MHIPISRIIMGICVEAKSAGSCHQVPATPIGSLIFYSAHDE